MHVYSEGISFRNKKSHFRNSEFNIETDQDGPNIAFKNLTKKIEEVGRQFDQLKRRVMVVPADMQEQINDLRDEQNGPEKTFHDHVDREMGLISHNYRHEIGQLGPDQLTERKFLEFSESEKVSKGPILHFADQFSDELKAAFVKLVTDEIRLSEENANARNDAAEALVKLKNIESLFDKLSGKIRKSEVDNFRNYHSRFSYGLFLVTTIVAIFGYLYPFAREV